MCLQVADNEEEIYSRERPSPWVPPPPSKSCERCLLWKILNFKHQIRNSEGFLLLRMPHSAPCRTGWFGNPSEFQPNSALGMRAFPARRLVDVLVDRRRGDVGGFSGGGFGGGIHHVHDRVVLTVADVQDRRSGSPPPERQSHRPGHVGNVGEIRPPERECADGAEALTRGPSLGSGRTSGPRRVLTGP